MTTDTAARSEIPSFPAAIGLFHFVCGWLDEHHYFEFDLRHVVR